jgi:hypothetical protein
MNRTTIIQETINKLKAKIYLEIGVFSGGNFLKIRAPIRIAVDPEILISKSQRIIEGLKNKYYLFRNNHHQIFDKYYEMTSAKFFNTQKDLLEKYRLDVVFIDGSHTYKQTYTDIINSLRYLNKNGVIMMHDCNPRNWLSAIPVSSRDEAVQKAKDLGIKNWSEEWNGDVWKAVVALHATRKDLEIHVLDCDFGIGLIRKGSNDNVLDLKLEEIEELSYDYLEKNRKNILNLKDPDFIYTFLNSF